MILTFNGGFVAVPQHPVEPAVEKASTRAAAPAHKDEHGFNPLTPSFGLTFWGAITFALLLMLLARFGWRPILARVEDREKRIRADLDGAEKSRIDADRRLADYQRKLDEATSEAKAKVEEAVARAEKQGAVVFAQRRSEADALIEKAKKQIEGERDKALAEIKQTVVELAMEITRTVVKRTASQDDLARTADEILPRFKSAM